MPHSEPIKAVRGMRDILPDERRFWRAAENAAREVTGRFGYEEIVTPVVGPARLTERAGDDSDAFVKEVYRFVDRGDRRVALRPEATAGVVRAYFEHGLDKGPQPSRLYLLGPMFRYDRPQKGRYRQFFQLDVEAIGSASPALDVEVIELARDWLHRIGLRDLRLELNTIGDSKCRPAYLELLKEYFRPVKEKLSRDSQQRLERNPLRLLDSKAVEVARICGKARSTVVDYDSAKFTSKWRLAEKAGARWVVLMRPGEAARRVARLREVASRTDTEVRWEELPARLA